MGFGGPLTVTTPSDTQIVITRQFDAPRHLVFACHTQAPLIRRWLNGAEGWVMTVCEFEPKVGGKYRYEWQAPSGYVMGMGGVIREIEPVERVVSAEIFDDDWTGGETVSTLVFEEQDGRRRYQRLRGKAGTVARRQQNPERKGKGCGLPGDIAE